MKGFSEPRRPQQGQRLPQGRIRDALRVWIAQAQPFIQPGPSTSRRVSCRMRPPRLVRTRVDRDIMKERCHLLATGRVVAFLSAWSRASVRN